MNIINRIIEDFNNAFVLTTTESEDELSYNEQVAKALGGDIVTTVPMQRWYSPFSQINDYRKDNSYNTLSYLNSLGYTHAIWELSEAHPEVDVCDTLNNRQFTLHDLLLNAQHTPPSPIFTLSHPDCLCFLKCFPPNSPEEIPDTAPGLPISRVEEKAYHTMKVYKNKLYRNMFEVFIDSFTMLPPKDQYIAYSAIDKQEQIIKYGYTPTYRKFLQPVITNQDIQAYLPLLLRQPIKNKSKGFQLYEGNNFSVVYINSYNRLFILPTRSFSKFNFTSGKEVSSTTLTKGDFFILNNELQIVRWKNNNNINYFTPNKNTTTTTKHLTTIQLF